MTIPNSMPSMNFDLGETADQLGCDPESWRSVDQRQRRIHGSDPLPEFKDGWLHVAPGRLRAGSATHVIGTIRIRAVKAISLGAHFQHGRPHPLLVRQTGR